MLGNDVVDLATAKKESNWKRIGFLDKIFTETEQSLIFEAQNRDLMVWNLWSRKESAYKIYNRETGIRGYFPLQLECFYENETYGTVSVRGKKYFTKTEILEDLIHTVAVVNEKLLDDIIELHSAEIISKTDGIPYQIHKKSNSPTPVSISHHGRFWKGIKFID